MDEVTEKKGNKVLVIILAVLALVVIGIGFGFFFPNEAGYQAEEREEKEEENYEPKELLPVTLTPQTITFSDGSQWSFRVAEPFQVSVAAEGLGKARFIAESPDGRLFIPDLVDYQLSHEGRVYILDDFNEQTKTFETKHTYLSGLRGSNSIAFYTDPNGQHWLYLALTAHLVRYPYNPGDTAPSGDPEIILEFPNTQAENAKSVVWHITRTVKFHDDRMYIAIGSGCNSCEQPEGELRAMIASMNPDGTDIQVYADGLRNAVDFDWDNEGVLYATENGVDHLGWDAPEEVMYKLTPGEHYGWPYCYELNDEVVPDNSVAWERGIPCSEIPHSLASFESRSAPLGIDFFARAHGVLESTFLVALHGSFSPEIKHGYEIVRVTKDGETAVFMDGFQNKETGERYARPLDFHQYDENSFFFTDDFGGRVFYVSAN